MRAACVKTSRRCGLLLPTVISSGVWKVCTTMSRPAAGPSHEALGGTVGQEPDRTHGGMPLGAKPGEEGSQTCAGCWGGPAEEALAKPHTSLHSIAT